MTAGAALRYEPLDSHHLPGILVLCRELEWPSYSVDSDTTYRVLASPGSTTFVASERDRVVGFAHVMSDGEIQAHLSLLGVAESHRRRGVGRELLRRTFERAGGQWLDLVSEAGAEDFYRSLVHQERSGFRVFPTSD